MPTSTSALMDLTTETNKIIIDAIAANNRRQIAYAKSVWGIVATPFPGKDLKVNVNETIERVEKVVDLTMTDFESTSKSTIELVEKVASQAAKAREESLAVAREYAKSGVTTIKQALESTEERLDTLTKRLETAVDDVAASSKKASKAS